MPDKDVTSEVKCGGIDGESITLRRCVCGCEFEAWDFILSIYRDMAHTCPECGCKLYFSYKVTVMEVIE